MNFGACEEPARFEEFEEGIKKVYHESEAQS